MATSLLDRAHPGIRALHPYQPGKPMEELQRELGIDSIIKLASNENPLGAGPLACEAARESILDTARYPDGSGFRLKKGLSEYCEWPTEGITLGNGSNEILELVTRVFLGPGRNAVYSQFAFAVYPLVTQAVGAEGREVPALQDNHSDMPLGHDLSAMADAVDDDTAILFVANPNNPTGTWVQPDEIAALLVRVPSNVLVVLDEAYREYLQPKLRPDYRALLQQHPNLVVTRTFSKVHGLAALRVGYGLSSPAVADLLNRARQPFNNNAVALAAAEAALRDSNHVAESVAMNEQGMRFLQKGLAELGLRCLPSQANFLTFDLGQPSTPVYNAMLQQGVILRPMASYAMPSWLRVTIGAEPENRRCLQVLKSVLADGMHLPDSQ